MRLHHRARKARMTAVLEEMARIPDAAKVRSLRVERRWTEVDLASRAKCSPQAIKDIEAEKYAPSGKLLGRLADAFDLEYVDDLYKRVPDEEPPVVSSTRRSSSRRARRAGGRSGS